MRYITNADNCLVSVSFGADIECDWGYCTEYDGAVPSGYTSLEDWYTEEADKLCRWKVVDGNLTLDSDAELPSDADCTITADQVGYKDGNLAEYMFQAVTQAEYDALVASGTVNEKTPYLIVSDSV